MKSSRVLVFSLAGLFCLAVWTTGCVPVVDYIELGKKYEKVYEVNQGLNASIIRAKREVEAWQSEKRRLEAEFNYYKQIAEASQETVKKLSELDRSILRGAKDAGLVIAAPAEAGEGEISVSGGKLRILGEVLFKAGSHELSSRGRQTMAKVARILNSPEFKSYYIRVDGHTDNQPLVRTKEKYKTNWILGAWRAHSVMQVLISKGIPRKRIFLASFGEYTPPDSATGMNPSSDAARRRSRRVEIALVAAK
jgi:chemotaxis protein MotB